jgi:hypothetical protein
MMLDLNLQFSAAQAITATAPSTGVLDLATGLMLTGSTYVTNPPLVWGKSQFFGEDLGIGQSMGVPRVVGAAATAFTSAGATTLQVSFQGAVDNGGGTIAGLTFNDFMLTQAIPKANITLTRRIFSFDWPKRTPGTALPRFVRLNYTVATGPFTGGTLNADVTTGPDDASDTLGQYPANYSAAS